MSRRIDIELTSKRDDATWTWRAAGAKQPKGVLDAGILPAGAKAGDVLRAEADFDVEGITILSVAPPKGARPEKERLQLVVPERPTELVTTTLVPKSERSRPERRGRDGDRPRRDGDDRARRDGPRRDARRDGPGREGAGRDAGRREGATRTGERRDGPRREGPGRDVPRRERPPARRPAAPAAEARPKPKRVNAGTKHRDAVLETLAPEQRAIAEHVLRGGIPAVRQAVEAQNAARPAGEPEIRPEPLIALAEELLPRLKAAEWRDRAEATAAIVDEVGLRDLRSIVAGADAGARDDESRMLARTSREALERRTNEEREKWLAEIIKSLDDDRLVRALRLSARPPDPGTRVPAELAVRLSDATSAAMSPDASPDRWGAILEAVAASPVRRTVKPVGLPAEPSDALVNLAKQSAGRVPALAGLLGLSMPPPPGPVRSAPRKPPAPGRTPRPPAPPRIPPPPPPAPSSEAPASLSATEPAGPEATGDDTAV